MPSSPSSPSCGAVAVDESALVGEPFLGRVDGREHPRVVGGKEPDERHHQVGGVEVVGAEGLGERVRRGRSSLRAGSPRRIWSRVRCPAVDAVGGVEAVGQRRSPGRAPPSTSAWSRRSGGARRGPPRCPGPSPASAGRRCRRARRGTSGGRGQLGRRLPLAGVGHRARRVASGRRAGRRAGAPRSSSSP